MLNAFVRVELVLLAVVAAGAALATTVAPAPEPLDLPGQVTARMRTTLESVDVDEHNHGGQPVADATAPVVCGVHLYGFEPSGATRLAEVRTVYGFHMCGVAESERPWDVAVKLAGPVIMDMSTDPPKFLVVAATAEVRYVDRLRQLYPAEYAEKALAEALSATELADLRRRYDEAAW